MGYFWEIIFHSFSALIFYLAAYEIYIEKGSKCQNPLIFSTQINLDIIENIFGISTWENNPLQVYINYLRFEHLCGCIHSTHRLEIPIIKMEWCMSKNKVKLFLNKCKYDMSKNHIK